MVLYFPAIHSYLTGFVFKVRPILLVAIILINFDQSIQKWVSLRILSRDQEKGFLGVERFLDDKHESTSMEEMVMPLLMAMNDFCILSQKYKLQWYQCRLQ